MMVWWLLVTVALIMNPDLRSRSSLRRNRFVSAGQEGWSQEPALQEALEGYSSSGFAVSAARIG